MAYKPLRMDQVELIIKYHNEGVSKIKIARLLGISRNTVKKYIRRQNKEDPGLCAKDVSLRPTPSCQL